MIFRYSTGLLLLILVSDCVEYNKRFTDEAESGMATGNSNSFVNAKESDEGCEQQSRGDMSYNVNEVGVVRENQSGVTTLRAKIICKSIFLL